MKYGPARHTARIPQKIMRPFKVDAMIGTDAEWIVIRGLLRGNKDTPFWAANPWPAYRPPGGWPPSGRNLCFQLLLINNVIPNMVCLTVALAI
jgi:hypothetical protein